MLSLKSAILAGYLSAGCIECHYMVELAILMLRTELKATVKAMNLPGMEVNCVYNFVFCKTGGFHAIYAR